MCYVAVVLERDSTLTLYLPDSVGISRLIPFAINRQFNAGPRSNPTVGWDD